MWRSPATSFVGYRPSGITDRLLDWAELEHFQEKWEPVFRFENATTQEARPHAFEQRGLSMILGMSVGAFTILHVIITVVAIGSGLIAVGGMFASNSLPVTTALFLFTTALTSLTGFLFPIHGFTPALGVGIVACVILAVALFALYKEHLAGAWRWIYVITAVVSLYLNVFVLVAQSFMKVSALNALAPTQTEPPFAVTQAAVLAIFILIALIAVTKFRPPKAQM
jgi:hypothetical protein